jgi:hypothetical protein
MPRDNLPSRSWVVGLGAQRRARTVITTAMAAATTQIPAITRLRVTGRSSIVMMHAAYIRVARKAVRWALQLVDPTGVLPRVFGPSTR